MLKSRPTKQETDSLGEVRGEESRHLKKTLLNRENVEQESYIAITLECRRLHFKSVLEVFVLQCGSVSRWKNQRNTGGAVK